MTRMWPFCGSAMFYKKAEASQELLSILGQSLTGAVVRCCSLRRWQNWILLHCPKMAIAALRPTSMRYVCFAVVPTACTIALALEAIVSVSAVS